MNTRPRHILLSSSLAALALGVSCAALAWACTPQSHIYLGATSGHAGDRVTVSGSLFLSGPVEIHWNDATGPVLATATGPSFSTDVKIPQVAPGTYYVHGVARDAQGNIAGNAERALQVEGPAASAPASTGAPGGSGPAAAPPAPASSAPAVAPTTAAPTGRLAPAPRRPTVPQNRHASRHHAPSQHRAATQHSPGAQHTAALRQRSAPQHRTAAQHPAVALHQALGAPHVGVKPSVATKSVARKTPATASHGALHGAPRHPSSGGVSATQGRSPVSHPTDPWAPRPTSAASDASSGPGSQIAIGVGMLGLGLVALFAGFAIAQVRRRRALAGSPRPE